MNKMNIKKDDTVYVLSGDWQYRHKTGKVLSVIPDKEQVIVQGMNMRIKHVKPRRQGEPGGRIEQEGPMHVSNVMLVCPSCKKPTRVAHTIVEKDGKQKSVRTCKKCGKTID
ncbi:MAG TPA: 50S ribosomal protein L24 [Eubacteriales bacterium]|jgi:large subunit ribosomal protein L24|nr:50S ribosomal protein L24 [Clostridia bacterium]HRV73416.1 50S ribosomal protein L24 [Eubacteriales bacterium]